MAAENPPSPPGELDRATLPHHLRRLEQVEPPLAAIGILAVLAGTVPGIAGQYGMFLTAICVLVALLFMLLYAYSLWKAPATRAMREAPGVARARWVLAPAAIIDLLAAVPVPLSLLLGASQESARLFGMLWALQLLRLNPAFSLLLRVLHNERQALFSVTMAFFVAVLLAATAAFLFERGGQPQAFASIPAAMWWAVTTITTTGYGDKIPATLAGRVLAGVVMVLGIGLFALWAGILASGFAQELRRSEFLQTWNLVVRLPLFRRLGAPALSEITRLLRAERCAPGTVIMRRGEPGDSMYFIVEGEVEVQASTGRIRLGPGQFFGEMALVDGRRRSATVSSITAARLLRLDVVEFRDLAARQPELLQIIEAESARRRASEHEVS